MKNFKRILAMLMVFAMILPMGAVSGFAMEFAEDDLGANWKAHAGQYSKGTWNIYAPRRNDYAIVTDGFAYSKSEAGGIKVKVPTYAETKNTYPTSLLVSEATTTLDGLSVVITPDELDSILDNNTRGNTLGILWSEDKIEQIAQFNETTKSYDKGLYTAVQTYSNGFRHVIPVPEEGIKRIPAFDKSAQGKTTGKALYIAVTSDKPAYMYAPVASSVHIVYYDGYYINEDGHPGYRWSFTARNHRHTGNADSSLLSKGFNEIDMTDGLNISVRADETLGYIVTINGVDYCSGDDAAYFPDANTDWYGYNTKDFEEVVFLNEDPRWQETMTYHKTDVDLTGLLGEDGEERQGYLTVGSVSIHDEPYPDHRCNYTVAYVNGVPAAEWQGETLAEDHVCDMKLIAEDKAPTCKLPGGDYYACPVCGAYKIENEVPATGHIAPEEYREIAKATCELPGRMAMECTVCYEYIDAYHTPMLPHTFEGTNLEYIEEPTCTEPGVANELCAVCAQKVEHDVEALGHNMVWTVVTPSTTTEHGTETEICSRCQLEGESRELPLVEHKYEWKVTTEPTCVDEGVESQVCSECGNVGETRPVAATGEHTFENWLPVIENNDWAGKEVSVCENCDAEDTREVNVYDYIKKYTDVKEGEWYVSGIAYCVSRGYMAGTSDTTVAPADKLTREQFVQLLSKVAGVDTSEYKDVDTKFTDVVKGQWYYPAVVWAFENGYTSGTSDTEFGVGKIITREQLARFFYTFAEKEGFKVDERDDLAAYTDRGDVSSWALENVQWAVARGLITGTTKTTVSPLVEATRAQAARIIMLFDNLAFDPVLEEWTVTFDANEGEITEGEATYNFTEGDAWEGALPVATREGYDFVAWVNEEKGITLDGTDFSFMDAMEDITFTATWKAIPKTWTVTFDANGGEFTSGEATYNFTEGDAWEGDLPVAELKNYEFAGWVNEEKGITLDGTDFSFMDAMEDITFTAKWEEIIRDWVITFNPDGGVMPEGVKTQYRINTGDNYKEVTGIDYPVPTMVEYVFTGWFWEAWSYLLDPGTWNTGYFAVEMDVDLIALWEECAHTFGDWEVKVAPTETTEGLRTRTCTTCTYVEEEVLPPVHTWTVTFDANGGAITEGQETYTFFEGDTWNIELPVAEFEGKQFVAWVDANGVVFDGTDVSFMDAMEDVIFTAQWKDLPKITFNLDEGTQTNDVALEYSAAKGATYAEIIGEMPVVEKEGWVFKGWWNRENRLAFTPDNYDTKTFDVDIDVEFIPIWDTEGEKTVTIRFENTWIDDFEPVEYKMNVGDFYMGIFCGEFPDPGVHDLDEWTTFVGWYIEELNYLMNEGDMWDLGYLALERDIWVFDALYQEV